jgi:hypothetical protein
MNESKIDGSREELTLEALVVEDAALIAAELVPVAVFLGWSWSEVRPDREIMAQAS